MDVPIRPLKLSVLDQSVAVAGRPEADSITETLALAAHCEALGYHRFWVSEHHGHPSIVGSAPEVLLAAIAARTTRIRIGSAGVMLPHYAPYKVAEQFRVLEALAPGRVDLGVGRAPGSDQRTARLLNPQAHASAENFPTHVRELQAWLHGVELPQGHPGHGITAHPRGPGSPVLWMLGSSDYGAQLAAHYGLPYAFAWFITEGQGADDALALYREHYRPSPQHPRPQATLCVWALAADTTEAAWHAFRSRERWRMDRNTGRLGPLLPPEQAVRDYTPDEQAQVRALRDRSFVGTGPEVAARLRELAQRHDLDEIVVITWAHDPAVRQRSCELLAEAFFSFP